jgi:hypothetical protein
MIYVYSVPNNQIFPEDFDDEDDSNDLYMYYTKLVKQYKFVDIFYGFGNFLVKLGKHRWVFIGDTVYEFNTGKDTITNFYSNDEYNPVAVGKINVYFLIDKKFVNKWKFPNYDDWSFSYQQFYDLDGELHHPLHKLKMVRNTGL